jgi:hypothetical protein
MKRPARGKTKPPAPWLHFWSFQPISWDSLKSVSKNGSWGNLSLGQGESAFTWIKKVAQGSIKLSETKAIFNHAVVKQTIFNFDIEKLKMQNINI